MRDGEEKRTSAMMMVMLLLLHGSPLVGMHHAHQLQVHQPVVLGGHKPEERSQKVLVMEGLRTPQSEPSQQLKRPPAMAILCRTVKNKISRQQESAMAATCEDRGEVLTILLEVVVPVLAQQRRDSVEQVLL